MSIASVTATTGVNGAQTSSKAGQGWGAMGAEDFVKLLTTQLQNQDPTDPVDNTQMLAQLAQFSSLSNLNDIKDSLSDAPEQSETLTAIATKLDTLNSSVAQLLAQQSATTAADPA
ncbi:MAG: hypothetical protein B7Y36_15720 [Novosphingobium sp. 28-62-57]|uniref:flagellar hook assembly protein FlgD n=1 Tax=unclassified Novosphingobium TaxID=2644732 RepID=UPI000BD48B7D|nr:MULTISPECIES: flagellar hook capping FlgD N-terminal domain-containing protein [unclassified Novosphingobium]OYW47569.1 MAG: hypothetical protein B7Z36_02825 [Novosphingobium sp. 12-63-9]OYZ39786.1 MAG: hypothetical protein B7Y31_07470 [Novosphingobium sp. 16-62-11]OZA37655.1 MAG: hypothetical protein B7X92_04555 [Novosphingobium sp. 17-62-9]OYZ08800.1 MAG: hypothetical protein B7Y36_15720 [Novosphingobium sp. 28-62-57]HQS70198.1 flagellar hook capping FlgD N-terminal domain-containing prot